MLVWWGIFYLEEVMQGASSNDDAVFITPGDGGVTFKSGP
jgi:hypothetical protein